MSKRSAGTCQRCNKDVYPGHFRGGLPPEPHRFTCRSCETHDERNARLEGSSDDADESLKTVNEVIGATASLLEMGGIKTKREFRGGLLAVEFTPLHAAAGRTVFMVAEPSGPSFSIAPLLSGNLVHDLMENTSSIETMPHLLERAFRWAQRRTRKNVAAAG